MRFEASQLLALLLLDLAFTGCVDPQSRFESFVARTSDARKAKDAGRTSDGERFDWSGRYLLALEAPVAPSTPLLFRLDAAVAADLTRVDLGIQPLASDMSATPRTAVGVEVNVKGAAYDERGHFDAKIPEISVPGSANPISGADIIASVELMGTALQANGKPVLCGSASGQVTLPIMLDLAGSVFGALKTDDPVAATVLTRCPEEAPDGG